MSASRRDGRQFDGSGACDAGQGFVGVLNRSGGEDRRQPTLCPSCLDDYLGEDNPARVIDLLVDELDLGGLGFAVTGRPTYHPATLLKLYVYGYLNRVPSSRRADERFGKQDFTYLPEQDGHRCPAGARCLTA